MAMGRDASGMLGNVQQAIESMPFGFLKKVDPQTLLQFINEEHPQTVALLISHMPTAYGAELLAGMGPERQLDVVRRISQMRRPSPEAVKEMETGLELRLSNMMNQQQTEVGGVANVAGILNVSERSIERSILDVLSREDPELSEEIRRLMFVFEDLVHLTDRDTQTLLKHVETSQWAMGLKGASDALKQKVLRNMSRRAAENLRDEIDFLGSVRITEVERVQQRIVDIVRHLEDAGEVTRSVDEQTEYVS
ncbi:MAG: flagellar motor switch protein FliG [Planctomycetota bacterium]